MLKEGTLERYLDALLKGDRKQCRLIIEETLQTGMPVHTVYMDVIWRIMVEIEKISREDRITKVQEHMATRINRTIIDQLQNKLPKRIENRKKISICCAQNELQELGAQMMADLFESDGWEVRFIGASLTNDDLLEYINEYAPDILLIYGTEPSQAPSIRKLIDTIRQINAWPDMRIMVSGGVFNRAEGLWQEIGADLFAVDASEAVKAAGSNRRMDPEERTINRRKRRQKTLEEHSKETDDELLVSTN